jgi:UDP-N-acetylmuramyl pentapeptide phosphotransferase/UDP-N-acetylglucosamine-1-phosphate transferase
MNDQEDKKSISLLAALGLLGWLVIFLWIFAPVGLINLINLLYGLDLAVNEWTITKGMILVVSTYLVVKYAIIFLIRFAWSIAK